MAPTPLVLHPAASTIIAKAGQAQVCFYAPLFFGGLIQNPANPADQGLASVEVLYVTIDGSDPSLEGNKSTEAIQPGAFFYCPAGSTQPVMVTAASAGHMFSAIAYQEPANFQPPTGNWPPVGPTTLQNSSPSYLYWEYNDDENLQAFFASYNQLFQSVINWFNTTPLPVYTNDNIVGPLLDWVAQGLYGLSRPSLPSGLNQNIGTYNTFLFNELEYNQLRIIGSQDFYVTTDDIFKRILTWQLYKGDGKVINVRWLKRRIYRFLFGVNGTDVDCSNTYPISVSFGLDNQVNIGIGLGMRTVIGGSLFNMGDYNTFDFNGLETQFTPGPYIPEAVILKAAIDSGVLDLPFQYDYVVNIA